MCVRVCVCVWSLERFTEQINPDRVINSYTEIFSDYEKEVAEILSTKFYDTCNFQDFISLDDIRFLEIGVDKDHVHFLIQSVPSYSPTKVARIVKSITAKKMFEKFPDL
ncbi:MAG: transposase, partial [Rickettsia endosymbiont of Ixodes persulcatus]|nr:transposase [Rickettsia endosymbiont of Ixodes persulcatus]